MRLIAMLVIGRILFPLALLHPAWEFHRDELLYFAMGDHLALRMQFPPLIAAVARLGTELFGDSVWAARVPAAMAGGALSAAALLLAKRLGGGRVALWATWLALIAAPIYVRPSVLLQPVVFDQLWATVAVAALVLAAHELRPQWWLLVGVALGLGVLTKASAVMYGALVLLVTIAHPRLRVQLASRWPWIGAAIALTIGLPSLLGQIAYGWPFLAQLKVLESTQLAVTDPVGTLLGQGLLLGPALCLVAAGAWASGRSRLGAPAQVATLFAVALLAAILWRGGKDYYAAPGYPALIAVGAVWIGAHWSRLALGALATGTVALALVALPMGVPMLPPDQMARYASALGAGTTTNRGEVLSLPQDYADMLGWKAQVAAVQEVYSALTPEERQVTVIAGGNYGQAGAQAKYASRFTLPYPVSTAGDFHAWGPGLRTAEVFIVIADSEAEAELAQLFGEVSEARRLEDARRVPEERDVRIWLCRRPHRPLHELWAQLGPAWG